MVVLASRVPDFWDSPNYDFKPKKYNMSKYSYSSPYTPLILFDMGGAGWMLKVCTHKRINISGNSLFGAQY
jgi:hypothetical protein